MDKTPKSQPTQQDSTLTQISKCFAQCSHHLYMPLTEINWSGEDNIFRCTKCISSKSISMSEILNTSNKHIIQNLPPLDDAFFQELNNHLNHSETEIKIARSEFKILKFALTQFLDQLGLNIDQISSRIKKHKLDLMEQYNTQIKKNEWKQLLGTTQNTSLEDRKKVAKDLLNSVKEQSLKIEKQLKEQLTLFLNYKNELKIVDEAKKVFEQSIRSIEETLLLMTNESLKQYSEQFPSKFIELPPPHTLKDSKQQKLPFQSIQLNKLISKKQISSYLIARLNNVVVSFYQYMQMGFRETWKDLFGESKEKELNQLIQQLNKIDSLNFSLGESFGDSGAFEFATILQTANKLTSSFLILSGNDINDEGVQQISSAIQAKQQLQTLVLDLRENQITDLGAQYLASAIANKQKLTCLRLYLGNNQISSNGAKILAASINTLKTTLSQIHLNVENNMICLEGIQSLSSSIASSTNLNEVHLSFKNCSSNDEGAKMIAASVLHRINLTYLCIDLSSNSITDEGARALAVTISKKNSLQNKIGYDGMKEISYSIAEKKALIEINFSLLFNEISDIGVTSLANSLKTLPNLSKIYLNLFNTLISDTGAEEIVEQIVRKNLKCSKLTLSIGNNKISENTTIQIAERISQIKTLAELSLDLRILGLSAQAKDQIRSIFTNNNKKADLSF